MVRRSAVTCPMFQSRCGLRPEIPNPQTNIGEISFTTFVPFSDLLHLEGDGVLHPLAKDSWLLCWHCCKAPLYSVSFSFVDRDLVFRVLCLEAITWPLEALYDSHRYSWKDGVRVLGDSRAR